MSRIVVVNPNASASATALIEGYVERLDGVGAELTTVGAASGPRGIDGPLDDALAAVEAVRLIARSRAEADAFVLACGHDPGLDACRQATAKPVVGIAEAGFAAAALVAARFSVVVLSPSNSSAMRRLVVSYGHADRLASIVAMRTSATALFAAPEEGYDALLAACAEARERDFAEAIVLPGAAMAGLEERLSGDLGMPVVCGLSAAVRLAAALVALGLRTSPAHTYRSPVKRDGLAGHPELTAVYDGTDTTGAG
jgi:allantoin racemase